MVSVKDKDNSLLIKEHGRCGQTEDHNLTMMELAENKLMVFIHLHWFKQVKRMNSLECILEIQMLLRQSLLTEMTPKEQSAISQLAAKLKYSSS
jgi:hypothetical protein